MKTVLNDLKDDLVDTLINSIDALNDIENIETRLTCKQLLTITISKILQRIDIELLEKEKQQIIEAYQGFDHDMTAEDYFSETFS